MLNHLLLSLKKLMCTLMENPTINKKKKEPQERIWMKVNMNDNVSDIQVKIKRLRSKIYNYLMIE